METIGGTSDGDLARAIAAARTSGSVRGRRERVVSPIRAPRAALWLAAPARRGRRARSGAAGHAAHDRASARGPRPRQAIRLPRSFSASAGRLREISNARSGAAGDCSTSSPIRMRRSSRPPPMPRSISISSIAALHGSPIGSVRSSCPPSTPNARQPRSGAISELTEGNVRVIRHRAIERLRQCMAGAGAIQ